MPRTFALAILLALLVPSTAAAAFKAHGSARQVYVTGAKPGTKVTVGRVTKRAGRLGGIVFRGVKPGTYMVRGKQVRVFSDRSAPPSKKTLQAEAAQERLRLPDHARRDQARDQRAPPERARARTRR